MQPGGRLCSDGVHRLPYYGNIGMENGVVITLLLRLLLLDWGYLTQPKFFVAVLFCCYCSFVFRCLW
ncbi:unnamed protein product [Brassica oleracea]